MSKEEIYKRLRDFIKRGRPKITISANERSLEIFGNEKFLLSQDCQKILNQYKISMDIFNIYNSPEPFIYYVSDSICSVGLIIENKDTWYSMRKILMEKGTILGLPVKALIYGEGRKIQSSFAYINEEDTKDIHDISKFYYFGDLDSSGIDIMDKLIRKFSSFNITPFKSGYEFLYKNKKNGRTKEMQRSIPISYLSCKYFEFLGEQAVDDIYTFCNHDYIIPQEILNYEKLKAYVLENTQSE